MALKAPLKLGIVLAILLVSRVGCVPLDPQPLQAASTETVIVVTQVVTSAVVETSTVLVGSEASTSTTSSAAAPATTTEAAPSTVTQVVTVIATAPSPPTTTMPIDTPPAPVIPTTSTSSIAAQPTAVATTSSATTTDATGAQTAWSAAPQMTDLAGFNVSEFAYGQDNVAIVNGIPAEASATTPGVLAVATAAIAAVEGLLPGALPTLPPVISPPTWDNSSAVIQLYYPEGSINPGSDPQGGADFYATPLDISQASNVSMGYSVFFPADFDWTLGGKLPGLYGGHTTCSGGDDALSCFSTRLMWREGGQGELYLYAPKDKQTQALCSAPPLSACDNDYGLSIGRGAFNFTPGAWTHVSQTVALNTPGKQDGAFILSVDGQEVMSRSDVFYRDVPPPAPPPTPSPSVTQAPSPTAAPPSSSPPAETQSPPSPPSPPPAQPAQPAAGGGLGGVVGILPLGPLAPVVGGLTGGLGGLFRVIPNEGSSSKESTKVEKRQLLLDMVGQEVGGVGQEVGSVVGQEVGSVGQEVGSVSQEVGSVGSLVGGAAEGIVPLPLDSLSGGESAAQVQSTESNPDPGEPVGFTGLFFSSFFGGHEDKYASPKDQYTWFKDFSVVINN